MKTVQLSEPAAIVDAIREGEPVEVLDGDRLVARVQPVDRQREHIDRLIAEGGATRGTGTLPDDFLTRPLAKAKASVLDQLLEDRYRD